MDILEVFSSFFPLGIIAAAIAVLAGNWWQERQRQNHMKKSKIMQSSATSHSENQVDGEKKSSDPPLPQRRLAEIMLQSTEKVSNGSPSVFKLSLKTEFLEEEKIMYSENQVDGAKKSCDPPLPQRRLAEIMLQSSEKVSSGSPSVFKLSLKTEFWEEEKIISRHSIGGGPNGETEKVLLLVGATGAGKTTLINAMVNYILGVEWKDEFRYKLVMEEEESSQSHSQKKPITAYTFYPMEGSALTYTLTIIDTPGYGDSKGLRMDRVIADQIKEFLSTTPPHGIDHLDSVGFVTQASMARPTPGQEYIFDSILSMFGKDVSKNISMLFTFADSQRPPLLEVINKTNVPIDKYFKFNNAALYAENTEEAEEMFNAVFWTMGSRSFKSFFAELGNSESVSLQLTREVWKEREQLQTSIEQLNTKIAINRSKIDQLRQEEHVLQQHEKEREEKKDFTYTVRVTKPRKINLTGTGKYTMTCLRCNFICHKNCPIGDDGKKSTCDAFDKKGNCKVCPGHCNVSDHKSLSYFTEFETVDETRTSEDLKKKYDEAVALKSQVEGRIKQLNEDIQNEEKQIIIMKNQIQQSLLHLDEIALEQSPLTQIEYLERLIEAERREAKPGWQQRLHLFEEAKLQAEIFSSVKVTDAQEEVFVDRPLLLAESMLQKSEKISNGSPSVYKLPTQIKLKREKAMIVKKSIGSPSGLGGRGTEKVLMVVGATGAGKTTLINGMANYILGVEWADDFRYKLVDEDSKLSQANSQTKAITAYTFYPMEGSTIPYSFTIIDTPGFGDTEGLKRDKEITNQIKEFFSIPPPDGIDHLDGIGFVTQASLARLTPTQEYIFSSILSIFGKDVVKNIFMLVTFADGQKPPVMEAIKKAKIPAQKFYKFNNSALFADNSEDVEEDFDAMFWKMGARSFKKFFSEFEKSESVSLQLTQEVLEEREQLQAMIEGLSPQITMGLSKIEEMRQEENILKQRETEIETNKSFTYPVEVTKPKEIDLRGSGRHTTTCLRCNFTCHKNCAFADDRDKRSCCAINSDSGNCKVCPKHCYWTEHKNLPYLIEYEKVTEMRTSEDLKKKYETALTGKNKVQGMIGKLEEYLMEVHTKVLTMIVKAQQSLRRLDEIALKPNPLTQIEYLELLIESEKNEAKAGWKQRVEYYEEAKRQAQILSKVKDVKAAENNVKEKASSGDKWYSRFKFW